MELTLWPWKKDKGAMSVIMSDRAQSGQETDDEKVDTDSETEEDDEDRCGCRSGGNGYHSCNRWCHEIAACDPLTPLKPRREIHVVLQTLKGEVFQYNVESAASLWEVKVLASEELHVPPEFINLIHGAHLYADSDSLDAIVEDDHTTTVQFNCVLSDNGLLSHRDTAARIGAINQLAKYAPFGNSKVADFLGSVTTDENDIVRNAALTALCQAAHKFDSRIVDAVADRLLDENVLVRCIAVQALSEAARHNNVDAVSSLLAYLDCFDSQTCEVRHYVIRGAAQLPMDNLKVVDLLCNSIADEHDIIRSSAISVLCRAAHKFDSSMIDALSSRLADENLLVSCAALRVLAEAARHNNANAISLILDCLDCLDDQPCQVRHAVVTGARNVPEEHRDRVIAALEHRFDDKDPTVSHAARKTIQKFRSHL